MHIQQLLSAGRIAAAILIVTACSSASPSPGLSSIPIRTSGLSGGTDTCPGIEIERLLVAVDPVDGLVGELGDTSPPRTMLLSWPSGYSARNSGHGIEVLDSRGAVVASEGQWLDHVEACYIGPSGLLIQSTK